MTGSAWWWLFIAMLLLGVALGQGLLFFFALLLLTGMATSALWERYCLAGVTCRRELGATRLALGEETELTIEIVNAKPLPLAWLRARDEWPEGVWLRTGHLGHSHIPGRRVLENWLAMRWYERVRRTYRLQGGRRGVFEFGSLELTSGDVFGFRRRTERLNLIDTLVVYPKVVPLNAWRLPAGRPLGESLARRRVVEDPLRFAGVRDYVPGDHPRRMHWKATAHRGRLQTRTFDPEANRALVIVLDARTSDQAPYWMVPAYLELVITAAASIACHALDERQAVGLYANALGYHQHGLIHVPLSRDPAQRVRVLEALARLIPFVQMSCAALIRAQMHVLPFGATVVAISAHPSEELQAALLAVQDAGHPAVLLTVGEHPLPDPVGLETHYLGGESAWQDLAALELA